MKAVIIALTIFCIHFSMYICASNFKMFWLSTEPILGDHETLADYGKLEVYKVRTQQGGTLNGTFSFNTDFYNDTYTIEFESFRGNDIDKITAKQHFERKPTGPCEFFLKVYKPLGQPMFVGKSNFPIIPDDGLCPIPKGEYYVSGADITDVSDKFARLITPGYWKLVTTFRNAKKEVVGGVKFKFFVEK